MDEVTIIIPVFNEIRSIEHTLDQVNQTMSEQKANYEVVVVNDGSSDGTGEKLKEIENTHLVYLEHQRNRGYGAAIKTGIRKAKYRNVVITDADGTYPIHEIPRLVNDLDQFDMVVGQRSYKNLPSRTVPAKWVINKLANYVAETSIPDINSGLRAFRKKSFLNFLSIIPDGFSLTTTITLGMIIGGFDVKFVPIEYFARKGKSKIKPIKDTFNFLRLIFKIGLFLAPLRIFIPFSIIVFFTGIGWGLFSWLYLGKFADTSTLIIIVSSIQILMLALIAEIINHRTPNFYKKSDNE